jgi:hypothetical protein
MDAYAAGIERRRVRAAAGDQAAAGAVVDPSYGVGTTEYIRSQGGYGVTLECGQHDDAMAPIVAYRAIRQALALLGIANLALEPPAAAFECLRLVEVVDRHSEGDRFVRDWASFDRLAPGDLVAVRADGSEVRAPYAGCIVFPDHGAQAGHEWFYLAQPSPRGL